MPELSRRRALVAGALAALTGSAHAASAFDLTALAALLAAAPVGEADFNELRFVSGLEGPLSASGTLSLKGEVLERRTLKPRPERFVVDARTARVERGGQVRELALDQVPELAALVAALRGVLRGDMALVGRHFTPQLDGSAARWTLTLRPRSAAVAASVRQIQMSGRQGRVLQVETVLGDGDRNVMTIEPR